MNRYDTFVEMFDHETRRPGQSAGHPRRELANICQIYPPEREALGVVVIGLELDDPPRPA